LIVLSNILCYNWEGIQQIVVIVKKQNLMKMLKAENRLKMANLPRNKMFLPIDKQSKYLCKVAKVQNISFIYILS